MDGVLRAGAICFSTPREKGDDSVGTESPPEWRRSLAAEAVLFHWHGYAGDMMVRLGLAVGFLDAVGVVLGDPRPRRPRWAGGHD